MSALWYLCEKYKEMDAIYVPVVSGFSSWAELSLIPQEDLKAHILLSNHVLG